MKETDPIKRNKALVPFSRDHHFGLLLVWKIRQDLASNADIGHICSYVLGFYDDHLGQHFTEEEKVIFIRLPAADTFRKRAEMNHRTLNRQIGSIRKNQRDRALVNDFAHELESHIRFEERVLFDHLQRKLPETELEDVLSLCQKHNYAGKTVKLFSREKS